MGSRLESYDRARITIIYDHCIEELRKCNAHLILKLRHQAEVKQDHIAAMQQSAIPRVHITMDKTVNKDHAIQRSKSVG